MTTIIRPDWAGSSTGDPDLFASGPASFKNLRSRETSSTPRSWVCGLLKKTRWPPTRNTNSSSPCGWTSPRCSISSTASLQLRLCGSLPLRRFRYSDSRCLLTVYSPSQIIKFDQHASRTSTIKPRATGLKQLDLGIDDISYPASDTSVMRTLQSIRKYRQYHRPIARTILLWPNEPNT